MSIQTFFNQKIALPVQVTGMSNMCLNRFRHPDKFNVFVVPNSSGTTLI